ncbi:hypothetical protein EDB86DRAFT_2838960 [Lactarius hatsudake]|nr:hypothetical protein EDB86DRAFT_2838960 [Lactarius hatsudake]
MSRDGLRDISRKSSTVHQPQQIIPAIRTALTASAPLRPLFFSKANLLANGVRACNYACPPAPHLRGAPHVAPAHRGGKGGAGAPFARKRGASGEKGGSRMVPPFAVPFARVNEGAGGKRGGLTGRQPRGVAGRRALVHPPSARMGKERAKGGGGANDGACPRAPPLPRGHGGADGKGRDWGAAGIVSPRANEGEQGVPLPMWLPFARKLRRGHKGEEAEGAREEAEGGHREGSSGMRRRGELHPHAAKRARGKGGHIGRD